MSHSPRSPFRSPTKSSNLPSTSASKVRAASPLKPTPSTPNTRPRTKSVPKPPPNLRTPVRATTPAKEDPLPPKPSVSIREQIALRRAEVKKTSSPQKGPNHDQLGFLDNALPTTSKNKDEEDIVDLGRWTVKDTIERGRSTGSINISSRSLLCLPSALFEIHLGITPEPLKSVEKEPPIASSEDSTPQRRGARHNAPSWFEAQDLQVLKAWSNEIIEIQPEISLFGSLKTVDLHNNKITKLPDTMTDLLSLTLLDLSYNALESLPANLFALPSLVTLNLAHNSLTALPFSSPFSSNSGNDRKRGYSGDFFGPSITRATTPLPRLINLDVSHNKITASLIDYAPDCIPKCLTKIDLSVNPLGSDSCSLLQSLARLDSLAELRLEEADIDDGSFPPDLLTTGLALSPFPSLCMLDLGKTKTHVGTVEAALRGIKKQLSFDVTSESPPDGVLRVIVGKVIVKESWELEVDRKAKLRRVKSMNRGSLGLGAPPASEAVPPKLSVQNGPSIKEPQIVKEAWEIEAEQGLLSEGGRRRARAAALAAKNETRGSPPSASPTSPQSPSSFSLTKYYAASTQTLTLPPSTPPVKTRTHGRAFSFAAPLNSLTQFGNIPNKSLDLALPAPTLPLAVIASQTFAQTLRVLFLNGRRLDRSFSLPAHSSGDEASNCGLLPNLEELTLEGCGLEDTVSVTRHPESKSDTSSPLRSSESLLPLLSKLFPTLRTLDLSGNALTSGSLVTEHLSSLILASRPHRVGLRQLRLRGNRLSELDGLQALALSFKGNREVPGWKLEELDLRDNEIGKLPPGLGLLPLDVLLVDGNTFRVPQRRVWEREGTKGLLSWLRGRID